MQHKKKVSAMTLSVDGQYLVSGDITGVIYIWSTFLNESPESPQSDSGTTKGLLNTFELHKNG